MITEDTTNKKLYSFIKGKKSDGGGVNPLRENNILRSTPREKAEILNRQFCSVFTEEDLSNVPSMGPPLDQEAPNIIVSVPGVENLLKNLNPHKATGPDQISSRFLNSMSNVLAPVLTIIFQESLDKGQIPEDWKKAYVAPIFKKGDKATASNYRPVSLTSICCKVLEHIIHSQLMNHLELNNFISDQQHGFRKRRSCESQLIITVDDLSRGLNRHQQIDAVTLDFSKAFDKVPHKRLAVKLQHYGITGKTLEWIQCFLQGRTQQVVVDGEQSAPAPVASGVPQGTVLGPLLFLVYINDLPQRVRSTSRLFADDCLLYRTINTPSDARQLQQDLDSLRQWEIDWQMEFNPDKCEVIRITNKKTVITTDYTIHGQRLNTTSKTKYLGVTIDNKLTWAAHVKNTTQKANNTLSFLRRNISSCPQHIRMTAYKTLVRPQLEYAATVWDTSIKSQTSAIEMVQRRAARFITSDHSRRSSVTSMLNDIQLEKLKTRRIRARATMLFRTVKGLVELPTINHLTPANTNTRGHTKRFVRPMCYIKPYADSFYPSMISFWNRLPQHVVDSESVEEFKRGVELLEIR